MSDTVRKASVTAAILGAVLSPIPFADEVALIPLYAWLTLKIGKEHGLAPREIPWKPLAKTALTGIAVRGTLNAAVGFIPVVAAVANAASASTLTVFYGRYAERACQNPLLAHALTWKDILTALKDSVTGAESPSPSPSPSPAPAPAPAN